MKIFIVLFVFSSALSISYGVYEACNNKGKKSKVYVFSQKNCPSGVLFYNPIKFTCVSGDGEREGWKADVCKDTEFDDELLIQFIDGMNDDMIGEDETCKQALNDNGECGTSADLVQLSGSNLFPPLVESVESEETPEELEMRTVPSVTAQTERMFMFMLGLIEDPSEQGPSLKIVDLLNKSFKILTKFCRTSTTTNYVPQDFADDLEKSFLFLFRESDISGVKDITVAEYNRIKLALDECLESGDNNLPFTINGTDCRTSSKIKSTTSIKTDETMMYRRNELSWKSKKYDISIDGTFGTTDFVHGLCFSKFTHHFNSHHLYQQAMERFFTKEILYRWVRPTKLFLEDAWDNMFSANTNNAMRNMDACIQAAYKDSVYNHRLERMFVKQNLIRKRRSTENTILADISLDGAGWCLTSEEQKTAVLAEYREQHCNATVH